MTGVTPHYRPALTAPSGRKAADCIDSAETATHTAADVAHTGTVCTDDAY